MPKAKTKKKKAGRGRVSQALAGSFISVLFVNKKKKEKEEKSPFLLALRVFCLTAFFFDLLNYFDFDTSDLKRTSCRTLWIPSMFCNNSIFRITGVNPFKLNLKHMSVLGLDPAMCQQEHLLGRCPGSSKTLQNLQHTAYSVWKWAQNPRCFGISKAYILNNSLIVKPFILDCWSQDVHQTKHIQLVDMFDVLCIGDLSGPVPLIIQLWFASPGLNHLKSRNLF